MDIGELAIERRHRRAGEQIGRHDPRQVIDIAEMPADGRQRGGDDGLVERAEEHRQHDAEHDGPDFGMRERRQFRRRLGLCRPRLELRLGFCRLGLRLRLCRSRLDFGFAEVMRQACNSKPETRSMPCRFRQSKTPQRGGGMPRHL